MKIHLANISEYGKHLVYIGLEISRAFFIIYLKIILFLYINFCLI